MTNFSFGFSLLLVVIYGSIQMSHSLCCDKIKKLVDSKMDAYQVLCKKNTSLNPNCCDDIKTKVELYERAYASLCLNRTDVCKNPKPLGMENGNIPDRAITASSVYSDKFLAPFARLRRSSSKCSWAPAARNRMNSWHQVDFGKVKIITGVATQGSCIGIGFQKTYTFSYSNDGKNWSPYKENGSIKIFQANSNTTGIVKNYLSTPIKSRFIRLHSNTYYSYPTLRVEYYGC
ncbi:lactadherin-like isoform X1 [Xenia sp. Carnegie-2017]|uniref:lactadherin-like isoform X1 n=1 Tax=Xenia sp. Carnegie-2017 TaxID=2897299 RepID=UPI001F04E73C|nr:lactadherin-like isoform X1 [Xenia sp. Carnegie-2017]